MRYQSSFNKEILSNAEKSLLQDLLEKYTCKQFQQDSSNFEDLTIDFIYTSAKIDGNTYDRIDTDNLLGLGITAGGKSYSDAVMLLNLREAFNQVVNLDGKALIDYDFLCSLYAVIMQNLLPKSKQGIIRKSRVSTYKPLVRNLLIRGELKHLLDKVNEFTNPFEQAIYLHCNLACLQCLKDGNKRTARLIQTAVLVKNNILPLFFSDSLIDDYQSSIVKYYETGEYKAYVDFFIKNYSLTVTNFVSN